MKKSSPEQALAGIKILDLSQAIAGPYCTRILAGFGADVLKIEKPGEGDPARRMGPFLDDEPGLERSGLFLYLNGNKRSITLNLESSTGAKIFKELAKDVDVVVESFQPGVMESLGLDYPVLEEMNPRLVMTSVSNFGQTGPYRNYESSHLIAWGMSGMHYCSGEPGRPVQGGGWLTHYATGVFATIGTCTALYQRNESGGGQQVDVSMLTSAMLSCMYPSVLYSYSGNLYNHGGLGGHLGIFPCREGHIAVNALTAAQHELTRAFFHVPETADAEAVKTRIASEVADRERTELFHSAQEWRIPLALLPTTEELLEFPQHKDRGYFDEVDHPVVGKVTMPGAPFKLMETPWQSKSAAPLLGEDNEEVYCRRLGYTKDDLAGLTEQGVI